MKAGPWPALQVERLEGARIGPDRAHAGGTPTGGNRPGGKRDRPLGFLRFFFTGSLLGERVGDLCKGFALGR